MKKIYALAAAALVAATAMAQNGAPLYITGAGTEFIPEGQTEAWSFASPRQFTYADGEYTFTGEDLTQFQISTVIGENGSWDVWASGGMYGDCKGHNGEWVDLEQGNCANIVTPYNAVAPKKGTIVVKGDLSQIKITMESAEDFSFTDVYFRGGMNSWGSPAEWKFNTKDGKTYWFNCAEGQVIEAGVEFKIADDAWNAINYGAESDMELDVPYVWNYNGANASLASDWEGGVIFTLPETDMDPIEITFETEKVEEPTGAVAAIAADNNVAPVYYNLQGVRVANPTSGLYIVVKGDKATKAIVK